MPDQATNLRRLVRQSRKETYDTGAGTTLSIALVSGKGGVGKSVLSLYLAHYLSGTGKKVLLVDANLQSPAISLMANIDPAYTVLDWLRGKPLKAGRTFIRIHQNLSILANNEAGDQHRKQEFHNSPDFIQTLSEQFDFDIILIDTQTSLNSWNLGLLRTVDRSLLITFSEPTAVIDTYLYLKAVQPYLPFWGFSLVVNQTSGIEEGLEAHTKLNLALNNFLKSEVSLAGVLPLDLGIRKACLEQTPPWEAESAQLMGALPSVADALSPAATGDIQNLIFEENIQKEEAL